MRGWEIPDHCLNTTHSGHHANVSKMPRLDASERDIIVSTGGRTVGAGRLALGITLSSPEESMRRSAMRHSQFGQARCSIEHGVWKLLEPVPSKVPESSRARSEPEHNDESHEGRQGSSERQTLQASSAPSQAYVIAHVHHALIAWKQHPSQYRCTR